MDYNKFYSIAGSSELKTIGFYPQAEYKKGYNPRRNGSFSFRGHEFPDFVPNLELQIHDKAFLTDYINFLVLPFGMVVSKKMKVVLDKHILPKHHFYKTKVYHRNNIYEYYWLHFIVDDFWEYLDKEKSYGEVISLNITELTVEKKVPIQSREQIIFEGKKYRVPKVLSLGKIIMKQNFVKYDLYQLQTISYNTIISENLKNALLEEGLTGFELKPFPKFRVEE
ncbi:hypothetical protein [Aquimarina pacifica]|uniref:hypothetical protein n=1 Tax=Aquimarina pacifica TaxID=1296415 RepID=UPI000471277E|nr:hypothetical protein [Aquimarina pacifica]